MTRSESTADGVRVALTDALGILTAVRGSSFLRNALMIVGGNGAGHLAILVAAPLLSRLYTPEQFGAYGAFTAVLLMVASVACLRFELAVPVPESDEEGARLATIALVSAAGVGLAAGMVAHFSLWAPGGDAGLRQWAGPALGLGVIAMGAYQAATNWAVRSRHYKVLATSRLTRSIGQVVAQLGLGALGAASTGLALGHVAGSFTGLTRLSNLTARAILQVRPRWSELLETAKRFRRFPLYSVPSGLLNSAGNQLPLLIVIGAYGLEVGGAFAFAQRIVAAPITVVSQAIGQVFVGEVRRLLASDRQRAAALYLGTIGRMAALAVIPAALLAALAAPAFRLAFGDQWVDSGRIVSVLVPMLLTQFAVLPVSSVLNLLGRTRLQLVYDALRIMLGLAPLLLLSRAGEGSLIAIGGYSLGMTLAVIINGAIGYLAIRQVETRADG